MRGQQGAAGEVIELLAQKSGSHPMGIMALLGDGVFGGSCRCIISTKVSHEVPMALCESVFVSRFRRDVQQIPESLGRPRTSILLVLVHHKSLFTKASLQRWVVSGGPYWIHVWHQWIKHRTFPKTFKFPSKRYVEKSNPYKNSNLKVSWSP